MSYNKRNKSFSDSVFIPKWLLTLGVEKSNTYPLPSGLSIKESLSILFPRVNNYFGRDPSGMIPILTINIYDYNIKDEYIVSINNF